MGGRHPGPSGRSPLRIGVVGAGFIGAVHARAAQRAGARIVGVAASTPANTEAAAAQLGADRAFADGETLVASPDIDVVHVCTPNQLHAPLSELALAAGKHVICEKPLALDLQTAKHLQASARREGAIATVPFVYRFYPLVREARARVANGIGPVRLIHGTYLQDWLSTEEDDNWRVDPAFAGPSRAFADIGSHWCDLVEFVTGDRLAAVCAELVTALPERRFGGEHVHAFGSGAHPGGSPRSVTTEDLATSCSGRWPASRVGRHQPGLPRPQESAVPRGRRRRRHRWPSTRSSPRPSGSVDVMGPRSCTVTQPTWIRRPPPT